LLLDKVLFPVIYFPNSICDIKLQQSFAE